MGDVERGKAKFKGFSIGKTTDSFGDARGVAFVSCDGRSTTGIGTIDLAEDRGIPAADTGNSGAFDAVAIAKPEFGTNGTASIAGAEPEPAGAPFFNVGGPTCRADRAIMRV